MLLRVQHVVRDAAPLHQLREVLGGLDSDRADEHRLPLLVALLDVFDHGRELRILRLEDVVVLVAPNDRDVRRDLDDVQVVDLDELLLLGLGGTRHPGELLVEAEVVLQRDRREGLVLLLDLHALFRLDRLVQAVAPPAPLHDPAGELVDDLHLAVLDHVVDVALVERLRLQRLDQVVDELDVGRVVEVLDLEGALDLVDRGLRGRDGLVLLVVEVVGAGELGLVLALLALARRRCAGQLLDDAREVVVGRGSGLRLAGDDQRGARLVDQDRVHLVDDREGVAALDEAVLRHGHVVAQVVEAELRVGAVGDVGAVGLFALRERHHVLDETDGHAEALEHRLVPLGVALGEVVVDRDEVDAGAREPVQVERERGDEGLALAGLHLGDVALVENDSAHHLDVEHALLRLAPACLAHGSVGLEQQLVERLPVLEALAQGHSRPAELVVGELLEVRLERSDVVGLGREPLHAPALAEAKDLLELSEIGGRHRRRVAAAEVPYGGFTEG